MKDFAKDFYSSKAWRMLAFSYMASKHWLCERCLKKGIYSAGRICHHKIWLTPENISDLNISLNSDNLECLCMDCHNQEHMNECKNVFDSEGQVVSNNSEEQTELQQNENDLCVLLEKLGV